MADRSSLIAQGWALLLGAACGYAAFAAGMPLPWMLGPMVGTTIAALFSAPIRGPEKLRPFVIPVIGVLLGSSVTAEILASALGWWPSLLVLIPFLVCAAVVSFHFYRRVAGYDPVTAYFCAMPGGLNDMLILGGAAGGQETRIALAHASRILIVVTFVVIFYSVALGVTATGRSAGWVRLDVLSWRDWLILGGCAILGARLGKIARLPAPQIVGPMILSGAAHVAALVTVPPPTLAVIVAQIVVGTVVGCRFVGSTARQVGRDILFAAISTALMIAVAVVFAFGLSAWTDIPVSQTFLGYSPGGLTEMSLLALAMEQDVTYVSALHIIRITMVIMAAAPIFALLRRR
ncbi:AbrB family transcriptional regulator [Flavimaricola marinus]|uniref:Putative ammonia monooxygenase n=1 Tax=Flavimaricola marinus TaxID=1819565 RepID=A0A238LBQ1_9RHOB|nr:AbrB family transcriptional regulator [Flavimaricola marinus]SMY07041.1 Putative ammonia monooxygenase [Flavimaricola marinus]